jgi:tRNA(fMet)-specific endonuclease VapC
MPLFLLDATTLTHVRYNHPRVMANLARHAHPHSGDRVGVASVNAEEVMEGWLRRLQRSKTPMEEATNSQLFNDAILFLATFPLVAVTDTAVRGYQTLRKMRLNVGRNDLRLAALALELGATVVTDNARDFRRVPNLSWVDWTT